MDIVFLFAAAALWLATFGLAHGCSRLQQRKVTP